MKTQILLSLLASSLPLVASPIVGAWTHNGEQINEPSDAIVFLENNTYFYIEDNNGHPDIFEKGTYIYDPDTSVISFSRVISTGTPDDYIGESLVFPIDGDTALDGEFKRVISVSNPLVGGFEFGNGANQESGVLVLLEGGVFFFAQDIEADPPFHSSGMERGTYTYDAITGDFSATVTDDTNGDIGLSDPEGPAKISLLGDLLVYKPGFHSFALNRVTASPQTSSTLEQAQSLMTSGNGMFGVMVNTVSGFFYTVERSDDLGVPDALAGVEGDGTMSEMLLEADPVTLPKAFFSTRVEVQTAIGSADIAEFLSGQSVDGVTFQQDGTWSHADDAGLWSYEVPNATTGKVTLTSNTNGNDPAELRSEFTFDFSEVDNFEEVPTEIRGFSGNVETEFRSFTANLNPYPEEPDLAPTVAGFTTLITGKTIKGINFLASNRWTAFGEAGNWDYSVTSPTTAKVTITFDEDSNDPLAARDDYLLTFTEEGGLSQVATRVELSDGNVVEEIQNTIVDLTQNTFAPTLPTFSYILEDWVINGTVFNENGTFVFNGNEPGQWTAEAVGDHQILLTQTYDADGNNPAIYREESLITFNGTTTVALNYKEFDGGVLDFETNASLNLD